MKAVQIIARGQCAFVDAPKPSLQPGSAIVKTLRLSLCGSDVRHIHYLPDDRYPSPIGETGHEMVGMVEAIDPANGSVKPGDIVLCLAPDHGAMQEYYRAPIDRLLPFAAGTPLEHAVQAQQFGTVLFAAKHLPDLRGLTAAVIGQGSAGLWFNFALQQRGAAKIIAIDLKAYRLALSKAYGATDTLHNADIAAADALRELNGGPTARCRHRSGGRRRIDPPRHRDRARERLHPLLRRAPLRDDGLPHFRVLLEVAHRPLQCRHDSRAQPRQHTPGAAVD